jgi:aldehyde dehydrogenase (NAD+)
LTFNDVIVQVSHPHLPFGGVGASGWGTYHGQYGFQTFSHAKPVMINPHRPNIASLFYPPYTPLKTKMARWFLRLMR